jgi:hypothetical protein
MQVEWYGQAAFRLSEAGTTVMLESGALPDGEQPLVVVPAAP